MADVKFLDPKFAARLHERTPGTVKVLDPKFAERLHERTQGTVTFETFLKTIGDFVVVRDGEVDDSDPDTQIAHQMFDFLKPAR
jgi:cephalosporin hydroxylase